MPMSPEAKALYNRIRANEREQERIDDRRCEDSCTKAERALLSYLSQILQAAHNRMGWQLTEILKPPKKSRNG